jgi:hypothetical protein
METEAIVFVESVSTDTENTEPLNIMRTLITKETLMIPLEMIVGSMILFQGDIGMVVHIIIQIFMKDLKSH